MPIAIIKRQLGGIEGIISAMQGLISSQFILRRFPAKNIPNSLVFLSIFCVVKIVT